MAGGSYGVSKHSEHHQKKQTKQTRTVNRVSMKEESKVEIIVDYIMSKCSIDIEKQLTSQSKDEYPRSGYPICNGESAVAIIYFKPDYIIINNKGIHYESKVSTISFEYNLPSLFEELDKIIAKYNYDRLHNRQPE